MKLNKTLMKADNNLKEGENHDYIGVVFKHCFSNFNILVIKRRTLVFEYPIVRVFRNISFYTR